MVEGLMLCYLFPDPPSLCSKGLSEPVPCIQNNWR